MRPLRPWSSPGLGSGGLTCGVNPKGGAIAIGHPLGATGARLLTTMLHALEESGGTYGLQTMCIGHGLANATIIAREP